MKLIRTSVKKKFIKEEYMCEVCGNRMTYEQNDYKTFTLDQRRKLVCSACHNSTESKEVEDEERILRIQH